MRIPIRLQILLPFATVLVAAVALLAVSSAWLAARRSERDILRQLSSVMGTIEQTSVNYTETILRKMQGLSGAEFVALAADGSLAASTLPGVPPQLRDVSSAPLITPETRLSQIPTVEIGNESYSAGRVRATGSPRVATLIVLYPEDRWRDARWAAAWPPLLMGALTVTVMVVVAAWLAARIARRVRAVEQLIADLAQGRFDRREGVRSSDFCFGPSTTSDAQCQPDNASKPVIVGSTTTEIRRPDPGTDRPTAPRDELDDLIVSANRLAGQLHELQETIRQTERVRLLAQLAGGLAHQLRNAITGARLAVQIHQRRCGHQIASDDGLGVALGQLSLMEEHVKRLLSLSHQRTSQPVSGPVNDVISEVRRLVEPVCQHQHVTLTCQELPFNSTETPAQVIADTDGLRTALLNLVLNGAEAAGPGGEVALQASIEDQMLVLRVEDTGPGPANSVSESLFEPFVTTKPEGVGLGLSLVKQAIEEQGGRVQWFRRDDRTVFEIRLPDA